MPNQEPAFAGPFRNGPVRVGTQGVVIEMGSLEHSSNHQNCINPTNKIPEYAREYKNEYLFIREINKEIKYFIDNIERSTTDLFKSHKVDRIKYFMKRFLRGQEKGKLKDISEFEIDEDDVENIIWMEKNFNNYNQYVGFVLSCYNEEDDPFIDPYPGLYDIYYDFELFYSKLKIKYKEVNYITDSDSDKEDIISILDNFYEIDSDSDREIIFPSRDRVNGID